MGSLDGFYWNSTILIENLSLKKPKNYNSIMLKTPIVVSISKDIFEPELEGLAKLTMDFWKYYKLETYKDKLVFNMKQSEWNGLIEKTSNLGDTLETRNLSFIFNPIFKFFENTLNSKSGYKFTSYVNKFTTNTWKINLIKKESSFVIELFWPKVLLLESSRNGGINFASGLLSYSFFFQPNVKNIPDDGKYSFLQIIEFKVS